MVARPEFVKTFQFMNGAFNSPQTCIALRRPRGRSVLLTGLKARLPAEPFFGAIRVVLDHALHHVRLDDRLCGFTLSVAGRPPCFKSFPPFLPHEQRRDR